VIFIDASIPKTVADELKKVRRDVIFKHDIFRPGTDDSVWLRKVGVEGLLGITHDQHIRTRPGERDAIMRHSVGCFKRRQGAPQSLSGRSRSTPPAARVGRTL